MSMKTHRPLAGLRLSPEMVRAASREELGTLRKLGALPVLAGGDTVTNYSDVTPYGISYANGSLTVGDFVTPPTRLVDGIVQLTLQNEDYWIIGDPGSPFASPNIAVPSGVAQFYVQKRDSLFLPAGQTLRPRAPGAEAPRIGMNIPAPEFAYAESWSGSIEVPDEARTHNDVRLLTRQLQQASNTFANVLQTRGETVLNDFVTAQSLVIDDPPGANWAAADPIEQTASTDARPAAEFAYVLSKFRTDKMGVRPDTVAVGIDDALAFDTVYGSGNLQITDSILNRFGLKMRVTQTLAAGTRLYYKSGAVGAVLWEKPLGEPEYTREGIRFTDVFTMEMKPVFVADDATAIKKVTYTP